VDAGVVARVADAARAEVFDDFLDQAAYWLKGNKAPQAGVVAGVVFEDTVRRACDRLSIPQKDVKLDQLITDLNERQVINDTKAKRARAMCISVPVWPQGGRVFSHCPRVPSNTALHAAAVAQSERGA
jgi:hypothetical protein